MSGTTLRMFIAFGGFLAVFWGVQHVAIQTASVNMAANKEELLKNASKVRHTDKVRGPLSSEVTLVGSTSNSAGQALVLEATVTAIKEVKDAKVKWLLPAGVQLVGGVSESVVPVISPQQPYHVQITIEQKSAANQQIHFVVSGDQPGIRFSSVSQYNTRDEEFLQEQKEMVLKSLGKQKQQNKKAGHIFH